MTTYSKTSPITNTDCVYVVDSGSQTSTTLTSQLSTMTTAVSGKQDASTAVTHTASTTVGDSSQPVYISSNGVATPISYKFWVGTQADYDLIQNKDASTIYFIKES